MGSGRFAILICDLAKKREQIEMLYSVFYFGSARLARARPSLQRLFHVIPVPLQHST